MSTVPRGEQVEQNYIGRGMAYVARAAEHPVASKGLAFVSSVKPSERLPSDPQMKRLVANMMNAIQNNLPMYRNPITGRMEPNPDYKQP